MYKKNEKINASEIHLKLVPKGSLQMKKTEIVWFFTKLGGGGSTPKPNYFRVFLMIFLLLNDLYALRNERKKYDPPHISLNFHCRCYRSQHTIFKNKKVSFEKPN